MSDVLNRNEYEEPMSEAEGARDVQNGEKDPNKLTTKIGSRRNELSTKGS